jgi:hypothetical protein
MFDAALGAVSNSITAPQVLGVTRQADVSAVPTHPQSGAILSILYFVISWYFRVCVLCGEYGFD